jgi:lipooligosaccharide transport system permease protein
MNTTRPRRSLCAAPSVWRAPELSLRWWPVFLRNLLVWRKLAIPSLIGNIAEPLIWLVAFGYGMGALVGQVTVDGTGALHPVPGQRLDLHERDERGLFEALYSAFSRMHVQKTWDGIMNAPVGLDDVVLAEMLWAGFKAIFTVTAILFVMLGWASATAPSCWSRGWCCSAPASPSRASR